MDEKFDLIIIGGGVSGLAASIYAGRFSLKTAVIDSKVGGTIILTDEIANYPGFKSIPGIELADRIRDHAKEYGINIIQKHVTSIDRCKQNCFTVHMGHDHVHAKAIIFATGTEWKKLGVPGEKEFEGKGVHYCALCDGPFYKDKIIGVIGGSDSTAKESLMLSDHAKKVYIIYRGEKIRPEPINLKRVMEKDNIEMIANTNVIEIRGEKSVQKVILDKPYNGSKEFMLDAVFIHIGHNPLSELAASLGVKLNKKGEIRINRNSETNVPGVYAAGDVTDTMFKQAITGVAEGVTASYSAYHYLNENKIICYCDDMEPGEEIG